MTTTPEHADGDPCEVIVQPAGEDPQLCGLELPCPKHDLGTPRDRWGRAYDSEFPQRRAGETAYEFTGRYLGERRDV